MPIYLHFFLALKNEFYHAQNRYSTQITVMLKNKNKQTTTTTTTKT